MKNKLLFFRIIALFFAIVMLPIMSASIYIYISFREKMIDEYSANSQNALFAMANNIEYKFLEMDGITNLPTYNNELLSRISKDDGDYSYENGEFDYYIDQLMITQLLKSLRAVQYACVDIRLFDMNGNSRISSTIDVSSLDTNYPKDLFDKTIESDGKMIITMPYTSSSGMRLFTVSKLIILPNGQKIGPLFLTYDFRILSKICERTFTYTDEDIYLFDGNGTVFYSNVKNKIGTVLDDDIFISAIDNEGTQAQNINYYDDEYFMISTKIDTYNWHLMLLTPVRTVLEKSREILHLVLFILGTVILISAILYPILIFHYYRPLNELRDKMESARFGNLDVRYNVKSKDEIGFIGQRFNAMLVSIQNLQKEKEASIIKQKEFEIKALQAQINPHFMYNTLNTIRWMSINDNNLKIRKTTEALIMLLKNTVYPENEYVTLKEDISTIESYILIQNMRYDNRFSLVVNIEKEVSMFKIPRMILQPIVENSIFHGYLAVVSHFKASKSPLNY